MLRARGPGRWASCSLVSASSSLRFTRLFSRNVSDSEYTKDDTVPNMNRRNFLQSASAAAVAAAQNASAAPPASSKMIGIQVGAVSFVDEGVEKVLDEFQQDASVNTLFVATFTYGRGIAGRQVPGSPLPDHGKQQYDNGSGFGTFQGGSYTKVHPQYYKDTVLQDFRAPEFGDYDVLEAVLPSARKRGMKTIC